MHIFLFFFITVTLVVAIITNRCYSNRWKQMLAHLRRRNYLLLLYRWRRKWLNLVSMNLAKISRTIRVAYWRIGSASSEFTILILYTLFIIRAMTFFFTWFFTRLTLLKNIQLIFNIHQWTWSMKLMPFIKLMIKNLAYIM